MATAYAQPAVGPGYINTRKVFEFVKAELSPHAGMYSTLARVLVTVIITFLLVATFRMPYAAITLYSIFTVDRSSPRAAIFRAVESSIAITLGVIMALIGVIVFVDSPLFTFAYYAFELFAVAFLIRVTRLPGPAMNMSMAIYSVHNAWERPYPAGAHLEQTLWVWLTLCLGFAVSVAVELAFVREDPMAQIRAELNARLRALSRFFHACATTSPDLSAAQNAVLSYASVGTSSVRQRISSLRTGDSTSAAQIPSTNALTALVARLVDVSATVHCPVNLPEEDRKRLVDLARQLDRVSAALNVRNSVDLRSFHPPLALSQAIPALPELERTAGLMPTAFETSNTEGDELLEPHEELSIFLPDAFTNNGYKLFALKTMFAAMLCYVIYSALYWPGISTSVVTCMVTALNTTGATKQKQILRLLGATAGGLIAIGALVFLLPELDSIVTVTLLVTCVSAFSAWFVLASQRLSYFGLQTALAFYLAFIQDYSATTQLAPARDRAAGVLLGLLMMWLVFDNLWPVSAVEHMKAGLAKNIRLLADLITTLDSQDRNSAIQRIRLVRQNLQRGFAAVHGHADSILFEVGSPHRRGHLVVRDAALRMQAILRTLFVVEIAICQYRTQVVPGTRPASVREAQEAFDRALAERLSAIAAGVSNLTPLAGEERMSEAFEQFESAVDPWVRTVNDQWLASRVAGLKALSREAANLVDTVAQYCSWC